ncbi:MAG: DUF349 domain-containing protein [Flavobacteriaceae bacterium]
MLEHTDNDSLKANEETVSEQTSKQAPENETAPSESVEDTPHLEEETIDVTEDDSADKTESEEIAADETVSEESEKESKEAEAIEKFEAMEPKELLSFFADKLKTESVQHLKPTIEPLVKVFNQKLAAETAQQKESFLAKGGNPDAFYFNPPIKKEFNELFRRYKSDRGTYYRSLEEKQQKNLAYRLALIEELKGLINVDQNINTTYNQFKDLQKRWKESGQVPRMEANNIWKTYHHHVGHFYDFLHLNRELRELDFKFNLEEKLKICEQAETLAAMDDISKAFRHLQTLHKKWKDELGPVDKEHSEQVWERFSAATKIIHDKRRYFLKNQEEIFEENLMKKQAIITQIQDLLATEISSKTNIHQFTKTYEGLRESFFEVGKIPTKKRDAIWDEFKKTAKVFRKKRTQYYKQLKRIFAENNEKRKALIEQVQALKTETNFKETTPKIIALQKEWKTTFPVSRKDEGELWAEFRGACNEYFDKLDATRNKASKEEQEHFAQKSKLLDTLKKALDNNDESLEIDTIVSNWNSIGRVPKNKSKIEHEFSRLAEKAYKSAGLSKAEITQKSYQNKLDGMRGNDDTIRKETHSLKRRIDEIKQEIIQLETNLQFFGKNQEKNPIVVKVRQDIAKQQERLDELTEKKRLIRQLQKD